MSLPGSWHCCAHNTKQLKRIHGMTPKHLLTYWESKCHGNTNYKYLSKYWESKCHADSGYNYSQWKLAWEKFNSDIRGKRALWFILKLFFKCPGLLTAVFSCCVSSVLQLLTTRVAAKRKLLTWKHDRNNRRPPARSRPSPSRTGALALCSELGLSLF